MNKPFKTTMKPELLVRKTLHKTKTFFHKIFQDVKSFLFGGYPKQQKPHFINPFFSASNSNRRMQELDDFYKGFSEQWDPNQDELQTRKTKVVASPKAQILEDGDYSQIHAYGTEKISAPNKHKEKAKEEEESKNREERREEEFCHNASGDSHSLAQKMKEFKMFDVDDVDHQLDIEEVLHYYSRLTCPIYLDIVDKFFMDMYSEFAFPRPSSSVNSSMRRLGPLKL